MMDTATGADTGNGCLGPGPDCLGDFGEREAWDARFLNNVKNLFMRLQGPSSTPQPPSSSKGAVGKPRVGWQEIGEKARGDALPQQFWPVEWGRINSGAYYNPFKMAASTPSGRNCQEELAIVQPEHAPVGASSRQVYFSEKSRKEVPEFASTSCIKARKLAQSLLNSNRVCLLLSLLYFYLLFMLLFMKEAAGF